LTLSCRSPRAAGGREGEFADDSYRIGYHSSITGRFGKVDGRAAGIRPTTSVDVGAEAVLALANNPSDAISGRYFNGKREARANAQAMTLRRGGNFGNSAWNSRGLGSILKVGRGHPWNDWAVQSAHGLTARTFKTSGIRVDPSRSFNEALPSRSSRV
jgi:hypothetical protein